MTHYPSADRRAAKQKARASEALHFTKATLTWARLVHAPGLGDTVAAFSVTYFVGVMGRRRKRWRHINNGYGPSVSARMRTEVIRVDLRIGVPRAEAVRQMLASFETRFGLSDLGRHRLRKAYLEARWHARAGRKDWTQRVSAEIAAWAVDYARTNTTGVDERDIVTYCAPCSSSGNRAVSRFVREAGGGPSMTVTGPDGVRYNVAWTLGQKGNSPTSR